MKLSSAWLCMKPIFFLTLLPILNAVTTRADEKPYTLPIARLTVKTVDEKGDPVAGVRVSHAFLDPVSRNPSPDEGLTDRDGLFASQGGCDSAFGGSIRKSGYYDGGYPFKPYLDAKDGKWQPWDVTYVSVMRKIENPIPMYARRISLKLPLVGEPCGYDLKESDWVSPWGKGLVSDFVFTMNCGYTNFDHQNVSMKLTFSNPSTVSSLPTCQKTGRTACSSGTAKRPRQAMSATTKWSSAFPTNSFKFPASEKSALSKESRP
jgi:hypothetical protein